MRVELTVVRGTAAGTTIPVSERRYLIGRDGDCQFRPDCQLVSRRHCAVLCDGSRAWLRDLSSSNGTYINGLRVCGEQVLHNGDRLVLGDMIIEVLIEQSAESVGDDSDDLCSAAQVDQGATLPAIEPYPPW